MKCRYSIRILISIILLGLLTGILATNVLADGTETLGTPGINIASGSGVIAGGTGLIPQPGMITIDVPAGTIVKQVLLYWEGQHTSPSGDNKIKVNGNEITGNLIGGPTLFFSNVKSSTYRADITALGLVNPGSNTLKVEGLSFGFANNGAGVIVIYDDGINTADIQLKDGNDLAYIGFSPPLNTTAEQVFNFLPATYQRTANITMFFSSVNGSVSGFDFRPSAINITAGSITTTIIDELNSNDGEEWDTLTLIVNIPAGVTSLKMQALSIDLPGGKTGLPASFAWNAAAVSVPKPRARIGDYVWNDTNSNGIQETGESGVQGVTVNLYTSSGTLIASTITSASGKYYFDVNPGQYYVGFVKPSGYAFSPKDQGSDNTIDSDANTTTGKTELITVGPGQTDLTWDAGIYILTPSGTGTPGYWKNHPEAWPVQTITIGGNVYTKAKAIAIMGTPEKGDKTYTIFRALVSAKLNVLIGNPDSCIANTILEADKWMAKYGPVGKKVTASSTAWKQGEPLYTKLDSYNNGNLCAPHRD